VISIIPTVLAGFLLGDFFEGLNDQIWLVVLMLILVGYLMIIYGKQKQKLRINTESEIKLKDGIVVGLAQVLALIPGVSRSGITILAGLNRRFSVEAAANFSFLMAAPTILGAIAHTLFFKDGITFISQNGSIFLFGNLASLVLGLLAVKTMINFLKKYGLAAFGWYRLGLGVVIGVLLITNVL
jgi:undecaprenyl-diphosphatase